MISYLTTHIGSGAARIKRVADIVGGARSHLPEEIS